MAYGFNEAREQFAAEFAGASDRLLSMVAAGAIAYLAGTGGWNGADKIAVDQIKDGLRASAEANGNKKSNAYRFANIAFRVAVVVNKDHKQLRDTLKASETAAEAIALLKAEMKANLDGRGMSHTLDNVEEYYAKAKPEKKVKPAVERIVDMIEKAAEEDALSFADLDKIMRACMTAKGALGKAEENEQQQRIAA